MTIENVFRELELLLSDIAFTGLRNVQPLTLSKLESMKQWMSELGMAEGIRRTDTLLRAFRAYRSGEMGMEELASEFCALEMYQKQVTNTMHKHALAFD